MGIIVQSINKQGSKIIDYTCCQDGNIISLTKEQIIEKIRNKEVENARIQVYKEQVIIRVNLDGVEKQTRKRRETQRKQIEKDKPSGNYTDDNITARELLVSVAKEFNIKHIVPYMERFFEKHPSIIEKEYTRANLEEKIADIKIFIKFWSLVADKQKEKALMTMYSKVEDMEYELYLQKSELTETV